MPLSWEQIQANAAAFAKRWQDAASEEGQAQSFITGLLQVFGVADPERAGDFEYRVKLDGERPGYIDYLWKGRVAIEMKSRGKNLNRAWQQLKEYIVHLPEKELPDLLLVSDFETIVMHERLSGKSHGFRTRDLRRNIRRFASLAGYEIMREHGEQTEVNAQAARKMAKLHDALKANGYAGRQLEVYLVRLLFCLFAEDTGIFPQNSFLDHVENSRPDGGDLSQRLALLFEVLNLSPQAREKRRLLSPTLLAFRYVNGGLFAETLAHADFDGKMRQTLLDCCNFDWSGISPAIFGSMFQGVLDKEARRQLGAHYTSEENILKLINPLFMDKLWDEFAKVKNIPGQLDRLHAKIANLRILDPACGCGNFLIIAYRELRRLELAILKMKISSSQAILDLDLLLKVRMGQFYGIEREEFPCQIAQVGMWLTDHQMNLEAADLFGGYYTRLPLTDSAHIRHGNALDMDWLEFAPGLGFIMGNPPFSGARVRDAGQKKDTLATFSNEKNAGNLDYVACWFRKAADVMLRSPQVESAFVATNSIAQGEQATLLWLPLFAAGLRIDFAYRSFRWSNDAAGKAAVHCVIIGFSASPPGACRIFAEKAAPCRHINAYLLDGPDMWLHARQKPLCDVPEMGIGNQPIDGGNYLFDEEEKAEFLRLEPGAAKFFHPWLGAEEFINGKRRYCLWLGDCEPEILKKLPQCLKRIDAVMRHRRASKRASTLKLAETPRNFQVENMPDGPYILVPRVSSEKRRYVPLGFISGDTLASDSVLLVPNASCYHFGILTSIVHNAWIRIVAGRLKSDYRYSKEIVYNNFPWPEADEKTREKIASLARGVLAARAAHSGSSLAALYDPLTMPPDLLRAHEELDRAVLKSYGFKSSASEMEMVTGLFARHAVLAGEG